MDRFWSKVDVRGAEECWEWQASKFDNGYGCFFYKGKNVRSHRMAWMLVNRREVEHGKVVMHSCNNKACCNPEHLEVGTPEKNTRDAHRDGLVPDPSGEGNNNAKLTTDKVMEIRELYERGNHTYRQLANMYGVGVSTIGNIIKRNTWKNT